MKLIGASLRTVLRFLVAPPWPCRLGKAWSSSALCWLNSLGRVAVVSRGLWQLSLCLLIGGLSSATLVASHNLHPDVFV